MKCFLQFGVLLLGGTAAAQNNVGGLTGRVDLEGRDTPKERAWMLGRGQFQRGLWPVTTGKDFWQAGLHFGLWSMTISKEGFCSVEPPAVYVNPDKNDNDLLPIPITLRRCATNSPGKPKSSSFSPRGMEHVRLLPASLMTFPPQTSTGPDQGKDPPGVITGRVVFTRDGMEEPIARAEVLWFGVRPDEEQAIELSRAETGVNGEFQLPRLESADFSSYMLSIFREGYAPLLVPVRPGEQLSLDRLVLEAAKGAPAAGSRPVPREVMRRYVFTRELLDALPTPGFRSFDSHVLILPGVLPAPAVFFPTGPGISPGIGSAGQFSVN